jgi:cholinesterase
LILNIWSKCTRKKAKPVLVFFYGSSKYASLSAS